MQILHAEWIKNYTADNGRFGNLKGIQGIIVPEAEGSGRGLKKSSKSAMGRRELRSDERQSKVRGKRQKESHLSTCVSLRQKFHSDKK